MADFSAPGIPDLPTTTANTLQHGDPAVLGFLMEWIQDGDRINRSDPSYAGIGHAQEYVVGEQLSAERRGLSYLPQVVINETRKATQAHVSALTDLKPLAGWRASSQWQTQADLLNQYLLYEWVTFMLDLDLGDAIKYALVGGTGDLVIDWDPHLPGGGAHQFSARDPRDTLALRPSNARSVQYWEGVCLREIHTVNALRGMYPTRAHLFRASGDTVLGSVLGRFRQMLSQILTPMDPLQGLSTAAAASRRPRSGDVVLYRAFFKDRTRNLTDRAIPIGTPGTNWAYVVAPGAPLYPRGRLVVATEDAILFDGPNPYWHGQFPVCRLKLWSVPWQFLGVPLFNDLLPVQDAINDTVNDVRLGVKQWLQPDVIYNRNAVSESTMRLVDTRRPGKKIKITPGYGEPYAKQDGPNPQVLVMASELWDKLTTKFTDLSGTANLTALLQLRQMPSGDTIEKYYEALTPEIRYEARMVEAFLRDLSEMVKVNYFQFLTSAKKVQILGDAGRALSDFDYDPMTLVPALHKGDPNYTPELDADETSRDQRAQWFHQQFTFIVAPNSILSIHAQEKKMMNVQLSRQGYLDFWTLLESLEMPNIGAPPAMPLPPLEPAPAGVLEAIVGQVMNTPGAAALAVGGAMPLPQYTDPASGRTFMLDSASGQILELRQPTTITERLQAQAMLGIGQVASPAGRKASGGASPEVEEKSDGEGGSRTTVTESNK